jgi:hypothetical protein
MGEQNVKLNDDEATNQAFMKSLLNEVRALETMLDKGMIESGVRCIGAEQEMFIVNRARKPALRALDILKTIEDERFTHELGLFNIEANLTPHKMGGRMCTNAPGQQQPNMIAISPWWAYSRPCRWKTWDWTPWSPHPVTTP